MKKILMVLALVSSLFLVGCSQKEPTVQEETLSPTVQEETLSPIVVDSTVSNESALAILNRDIKSIYFSFDKSNIDSTQDTNVNTDVALVLSPEAKYFNIILEGNCDEQGSDEYNFALGLKRAQALKKALVQQGVLESRISLKSLGEGNPTCTDKTVQCFKVNRRVDFNFSL